MGQGASSFGYQVFKVHPQSPAAAAGLEPFFDFIVAADGVTLEAEDETFVNILKAFVGRPLVVQVYSVKTGLVRDVVLIPSQTWGGTGLLGLSIRFCPYEKADELVWHVLNVQAKSPAAEAGLISELDYIVGARDAIFSSETCLFKHLDAHVGRAVALYVYNSVTDEVREVQLRPTPNWAGPDKACGTLGCSIAFGVEHRIDFSAARQPPRGPTPELALVASAQPGGGKRSRATEHTTLSRLPDAHQYDRGADLEPEPLTPDGDLPPAALGNSAPSATAGDGRQTIRSAIQFDYTYDYRLPGEVVQLPDDLVSYRDNPRLFLASARDGNDGWASGSDEVFSYTESS
ncbi:golgi reassembly stacking protein 1 [Thecamonas trahens ATCC 50062]|uniref:Golgi reassembly stacking protein 1 n=1 Tax=Thecamonas trahens ATCC 50062 TaxID=461836 RepID=A0A0L0DH40_THETB|nr:golgi reassembly stacking protein 1 [Thecamonas trahens ATCC 50062]KNC51456.1 golgi reassembly stacking protein 1 [Thecamonas trahens ATCC 50062]|eukprot:XP_013756118.1 golgi reassembly stacking protein 1 [Thecamonas trahens ATCC 50062]